MFSSVQAGRHECPYLAMWEKGTLGRWRRGPLVVIFVSMSRIPRTCLTTRRYQAVCRMFPVALGQRRVTIESQSSYLQVFAKPTIV